MVSNGSGSAPDSLPMGRYGIRVSQKRSLFGSSSLAS